ncbi:MAG: patatin-like phospholipase family protein [Flavobacterium sp.]|nr:patatin-like phospholipase family protein [Flavobacterium sp.]
MPIPTASGLSDSPPLQDFTTPFEHIALAFSGGGFRAGAFGLGVLSYFNEAQLTQEQQPLLKKVTYMSSTSGGTITAAMYALYDSAGRSFGDFYKALYENLESDKLLNRVFAILNDSAVWKKYPHKTRNIINAFAITYDEMLFDHATVGDLKHKQLSHLEEVCFNTTEFYRGLLYRQAIKISPDVDADNDYSFLFGNYIINMNQTEAEQLRLADLLAASSCFPAGFEPIIFPDDFRTGPDLLPSLHIELQEDSITELTLLYGESEVKKLQAHDPPLEIFQIAAALKGVPFRKELKIGMMDGGITDNQGIESVIRANERRLMGQTAFKPFDLMLINDVGSPYMDPYQLPESDKMKPGWEHLNVRNIFIAASIIVLLSIWGLIAGFRSVTVTGKIILAVSTIAFMASAIVTGTLLRVRNSVTGKIRQERGLNLTKTFSAEVIEKMFEFFSRTPLGVIATMLKLRGNSVLILNNDVFLKRVRQLLYKQFFSMPGRKLRVKANHIYDLSFTNDINAKRYKNEQSAAIQKLQVVAEQAFCMGTTLWFDTQNIEQHTLAAIIACGQFTTCYNLLEYTRRLQADPVFNTLTPEYQNRVTTLQQQFSADYEKFKDDPFWLYNNSGKDFGITGFKPCDMKMFPFPKGNFGGLRRD